MSQAKMVAARQLIEERRYEEARMLLRTIDEPKAREWLVKLDRLHPSAPVARMPPPPPPQGFQAAPNARPTSMYEYETMQARTKSYTHAVVIVIVLYWFLFIPGLIANVLYHNEGKRMEEIAGVPLPGVAALGVLRKLSFFLLVLLLAGLVLLFLVPMFT